MDIICTQRPTSVPEYKGAFRFLQMISQETNLILLGRLADACDERLVLTRFVDREAFRLEQMVEQIATFKQKPRWLFAGRGCLKTGYTSLALTRLHKGKLAPIPRQAPATLGGHVAEPSSDLIVECLGRMVAWSNLATEVATTEFPNFELLACFQAFILVDPLPVPATACNHLRHLLTPSWSTLMAALTIFWPSSWNISGPRWLGRWLANLPLHRGNEHCTKPDRLAVAGKHSRPACSPSCSDVVWRHKARRQVLSNVFMFKRSLTALHWQ